MLRRILGFSLIVVLGGCAQSNDTPSATASSELTLPIPAGYCQLAESNPMDREMIDTMRRVNASNNRVLSVFADCKDLERFRKLGLPMDHTGTYFAPKSADGKHLSVPRGKFVQQVANQIKRSDIMAKAKQQARKNVEQSGTDLKLEANVTKLIDTDENAAYMGSLQTWDYGGGNKQTTSVVTALTVVQGRVVSLNMFAPHKNKASTRKQLAETQKNVRRLLDANGG